MSAITKAQQAKADKYLDKLVRTREYGVVTWREYVEKTIKSGGRVEAVEVPDYLATARLREQYELFNRGFNVPWGNESHPKTIEARRMKEQIARGLTATEYRMYHAGVEDYWTILTKTAFDYARGLEHAQ